MAATCDYDTCKVGVCTDNATNPCKCFHGFEGANCDQRKDMCVGHACPEGYHCQDLLTEFKCVLIDPTVTAKKDVKNESVEAWILVVIGIGTVLACILWLVVYIQFDKGNLQGKSPNIAPKKNLKKLKKNMNLDGYEKSKQAERDAKLDMLNKRWQIPESDLQIMSVLDSGEFNCIYSASWSSRASRKVVLKRAKDPMNGLVVSELFAEFEIMSDLTGHANIVEFLGVSYMGRGHDLNLVMPLYSLGSLRCVLLDLRNRKETGNQVDNSGRREVPAVPRTGGQLVLFAVDVARGMRQVATNGYVFRDLAARNVLVDNSLKCRITDFGMAKTAIPVPGEKSIELSASVHQLPLLWRWMAPESVTGNIYSTKTDVWQFGIVMWEIVTLGAVPYPDYCNTEVLSKCVTNSAYKMPKPAHCSNEWYTVMTGCWNKPGIRPSFQTLYRDLKALKTSGKGVPDLQNYTEENYLPLNPPEKPTI